MRRPTTVIGTVTAEPRGVDLVKFRRHAELVVVVAIKWSSVCIFVSFLCFNFFVTMFADVGMVVAAEVVLRLCWQLTEKSAAVWGLGRGEDGWCPSPSYAYTGSNHGEQPQPESGVDCGNDDGRGNGVRTRNLDKGRRSDKVPWCDHYKRGWNTRETCWKVKEKPPNWKKKSGRAF
ncbi:hypothetical protein KIW84_031238 [Lathyrus oleraceus]|uniref:Uncharacterized protein n=1 Tax=Pisum sativum TaxID=3888 RepID=A0A9D5B0C6_PEA|nr:hypothetical protein KIW84_031238 [Pisum sativum]